MVEHHVEAVRVQVRILFRPQQARLMTVHGSSNLSSRAKKKEESMMI